MVVQLPRDSIRTNAVALLAGQIVTWTLTATTFALVPRYLGARDVGVYSLAATFAIVASSIASLGMGAVIARDVARFRDRFSVIVGSAAWLSLGLGSLAGLIAVSIGLTLNYSASTVLVIALQCSIVPLLVLTGTMTAALQGLEIMKWSTAIDILTKALLLAGALLAIAAGAGVVGITLASVSASIVAAGVQLAVVRKFARLWVLSSFSRLEARRLLVASVPFLLITISWMLYGAVDVFLLSFLGDEASIGVYSTVMRLLGTLLFVPTTIMMVTFPRLSASSHEASQGRLAGQALRLTVSSGIALSIGAIAISDPLFVSILGDSFMQHTGPVVVAFALSVVPTSVSTVASRMAFAADRQKAVSWIGTGAVVAKILLGLVLIPLFGEQFDNPALGAAVALVLTESGMSIAMLRFLPAGTFAGDAGAFYRRLSLAGAFAGTVVLVAYPLSPLGAGVFGACLYGGLLLALRVYSPGEIRGAAAWLGGRRGSPQQAAAR